MTRGRYRTLDDFITGNQGYDHPDNAPARCHCSECGSDNFPEDMSEAYPEKLCAECFERGFRFCECGEIVKLDALVCESPPSVTQYANAIRNGISSYRIDYYCEDCRGELCINCKGIPDFCRSEYCLIPAREAEALYPEREREALKLLAAQRKRERGE